MRDHHHFLFLAGLIEADSIVLDAEEARHAVAVLRYAPGDQLRATDGSGMIYECRVDAVGKERLSAAILDRTAVQRHACPLHLYIGLPERDAFEALVRDLAALGVERITPLAAAHCQRPWWEAWSAKHEARLHGKMVVGMKQSCYPFLPRLDPPIPFGDSLNALSGTTLLADADGRSFSSIIDAVNHSAAGTVSCIAGPPGGFSPEETAALKEKGAVPVRIAAARLTTELAAVVMVSELLGVTL